MSRPDPNQPLYTALLQGSLRLSRQGDWWHNGKPFTNQKVAELFHRSLAWDPSRSAFVIRLGQQQATFDCEDTAYFVLSLVTSCLPWQIALNDGRLLALDPHSLRYGSEGQFYCAVRAAVPDQGVEASAPLVLARFSRPAHQSLVEHAEDERSLRVGDEVITPLPVSAEPVLSASAATHLRTTK